MRAYLQEPALKALIGVNLFTMALALLQGWGIMPLLYVFWGQSVLIGLFNAYDIFTLKEFSTENFKMNNREVAPTAGTKRSVGIFFLIHYGFFHLMYFIFIPVVGVLQGKDWGENFDVADFKFSALMVLLNILLFFFTYLHDFRFKRRHFRIVPNIGTLMFYPYMRIIPMHLTIILTFWIGNRNTLLLFLCLKMAADVGMYLIDRHRYSKAEYIDGPV